MDRPRGERCQECGELYAEVWRAPDDLWEEVTGDPDGGGLLCMQCFDALAWDMGKALHWGCKEDEHPLEPEILAMETRLIEMDELISRLRTCNAHLEEIME